MCVVLFFLPDGHLSHLQHNIQTQRDQQGLHGGVPQHDGERRQAPKDPPVYRQSQEQHPEDPWKRQDSSSDASVSCFQGRWYKYLSCGLRRRCQRHLRGRVCFCSSSASAAPAGCLDMCPSLFEFKKKQVSLP